MSFKKKRVIFCVSPEEINKHLKFCKLRRIYAPNDEEWLKSTHTQYTVDVGKSRLVLKYYDGTCLGTYIFQLDNAEVIQKIMGSEAYSRLQRMSDWNIPDLSNIKDFLNDDLEEVEMFGNPWNVSKCSGVLYHKEEDEGKEFNDCYGYDLNSSFPYAMLGPMPDTTRRIMHARIQQGEVGYRTEEDPLTGKLMLRAVYSGIAEYIFPLIESPFKHFVSYYYNIKNNSKHQDKKEVAKQVLNYAIGYIRRKNPFIHCSIITRSNEHITKYVDENTLYCNTDSIVSKVRRPDIEANFGNEIGQWKLEHQGTFKLACNGYQWNNALPTIRGVPKEWYRQAYPNGFDILRDRVPGEEFNVYKFNFIKMEVYLNDYKKIQQG